MPTLCPMCSSHDLIADAVRMIDNGMFVPSDEHLNADRIVHWIEMYEALELDKDAREYFRGHKFRGRPSSVLLLAAVMQHGNVTLRELWCGWGRGNRFSVREGSASFAFLLRHVAPEIFTRADELFIGGMGLRDAIVTAATANPSNPDPQRASSLAPRSYFGGS